MQKRETYLPDTFVPGQSLTKLPAEQRIGFQAHGSRVRYARLDAFLLDAFPFRPVTLSEAAGRVVAEARRAVREEAR